MEVLGYIPFATALSTPGRCIYANIDIAMFAQGNKKNILLSQVTTIVRDVAFTQNIEYR